MMSIRTYPVTMATQVGHSRFNRFNPVAGQLGVRLNIEPCRMLRRIVRFGGVKLCS
jgi:hypothetical protein